MAAHAIILALNEEAAISSVVRAVREHIDHVIVVDNGSSDATAQVATGAGADVVNQPERGYGAACLAGITALEGCPEDDAVLFIDGDGQSDPSDIPGLLAPIEAGVADLVIGSRAKGAEPGALSGVQRFGNWLAASLLGQLYGASCTDLGPTRAISLGALQRLLMRDRGFGWTVEMQVRAALIGLRVVEVPVRYRPRASGASKISGTVRGSVKAGATILWTLYSARKPR